MKIWIPKTMVGFGPSVKQFNGKSVEMRNIFDTKRAIVNKPSVFIPPYLATSMK